MDGISDERREEKGRIQGREEKRGQGRWWLGVPAAEASEWGLSPSSLRRGGWLLRATRCHLSFHHLHFFFLFFNSLAVAHFGNILTRAGRRRQGTEDDQS